MPSKNYTSLQDQQRRSKKRNKNIANLRKSATAQERRDLKNYKQGMPSEQLSNTSKRIGSRVPQKRRYFGNSGHALKVRKAKNSAKFEEEQIAKVIALQNSK